MFRILSFFPGQYTFIDADPLSVLPPGIRKKVENGGKIPPGIWNKYFSENGYRGKPEIKALDLISIINKGNITVLNTSLKPSLPIFNLHFYDKLRAVMIK